MFRRSFLAALVAGIATTKWRASVASPGAKVNVIDAMPTFWKFWDSTVHLPLSARVAAFFDTVVAAYPDLFHHGLIASGPLTDLGSTPEAQDRVARYLQALQPHIPTMMNITTAIHENFSRYVGDLSAAFADYAPATPVFFTVSLFGFAGGMNLSGDTTGLYFGIDELARTLGSTKDLKIVLEHELFHQYHYQIAPEIGLDPAAWAYMWEEGLATYASQKLNPGCTADQALLTPPRLSEHAKPHLRDLAKRLIDNRDAKDFTLRNELFSPEHSPEGLPARSGYYLGFRTAELLGSDRSLTELAHLRGDNLKQTVMSALTELRNTA